MSSYDIDLIHQIRSELEDDMYYYHDKIRETIQWLKDRNEEMQIGIDYDLIKEIETKESELFEAFEAVVENFNKDDS